jgi:tetratricopeptide (TPR) repeat protein
MTFLAHGFSHDAVACLAEAGRLDPHEARWPYLHGKTVLDTDPQTAAAELRRAVQLCGNVPDAPRLLLAELLLEQGSLDEAARHFHRLLESDPRNGRAQLGLGRLACQRSAWVESLLPLQRAAEDVRTRKAALLQLAAAYRQVDDSAAAQDAHRQASRLPEDPRWPDPFADEVDRLQTGLQVLLATADRLLNENRLSEAQASLRQTVRDYPESQWAWLLLGRTLLQARDLPAAEEALRTAARCAPDTVEAHFYLGVALFQQNDFAQAAASFRTAARLRPTFGPAHYNLGHCLLRQGDLAGAGDAFRATIRCQPNFVEGHVSLGELAARQGQDGEALRHLTQALELDPTHVRARKRLGEVVRRIARRIGLQAGLQTPEAWRWSSLWHRVQGGAAVKRRPVPLHAAWPDVVHRPQTEAEFAAVRGWVVRGTPFREQAWQLRTAAALGLQST